MANGTFIQGKEKERPGTYINVENAKPQTVQPADIGIVIMPLINHDWGPVGEFIEINVSEIDSNYPKLGYNILDDKMVLFREIFKSAKTIIAYKPNGGEKATATVGNLNVEALYPGTLGNTLKIVITDNAISGKNVSIYKDIEKVVYFEGVATVEELTSGDWVNFSGTGALTNTSGTSLADGTNAALLNSDVTKFLDDMEVEDFNVAYFPLTDITLLNAFKAKIKYFNYDIGKHVEGVCSGLVADCEFITNVTVGIKLNDGTVLTPVQAAAWVAGASSAATSRVDLTYKVYDGAVDVVPRLKDSEIKQALKNGEFIFTIDKKKVIVENDINTLTTYTTTKNEDYSSNRFIRTIQDFQQRAEAALVPNKYDTDNDGQNLAKQALVDILIEMQKEKALKNVDEEKDVILTEVSGESVYASVALQPNRSAKKYYITVKTS